MYINIRTWIGWNPVMSRMFLSVCTARADDSETNKKIAKSNRYQCRHC